MRLLIFLSTESTQSLPTHSTAQSPTQSHTVSRAEYWAQSSAGKGREEQAGVQIAVEKYFEREQRQLLLPPFLAFSSSFNFNFADCEGATITKGEPLYTPVLTCAFRLKRRDAESKESKVGVGPVRSQPADEGKYSHCACQSLRNMSKLQQCREHQATERCDFETTRSSENGNGFLSYNCRKWKDNS